MSKHSDAVYNFYDKKSSNAYLEEQKFVAIQSKIGAQDTPPINSFSRLSLRRRSVLQIPRYVLEMR